jgi:hypothetical protein
LELKKCSICLQEKTVDMFSKSGQKWANGLMSKCKQCHSDKRKRGNLTIEEVQRLREESRIDYKQSKQRHVRYAVDNYTKKMYGISLSRKAELIKQQKESCTICGTTDPKHKNGWQIDHDHETGKVRGIVCHACNLTLGSSKEDIHRLQRCLAYIRFHKRKIIFPEGTLWKGLYPQGGLEREIKIGEVGKYVRKTKQGV